MRFKLKSLYELLFEDKDINDKDATEADVSILSQKGIKARKSRDSVDDQIDALILKYESISIREKEDLMSESMLKKSLSFLLMEQEEEAAEEVPAEDTGDSGERAEGAGEDSDDTEQKPAGSEDMQVTEPGNEEIPNLDIDMFTKRCVRMLTNYRNLLRVEEAIVNRIKNFLDAHYGDAYVSEFLNVLENQYGIDIDEFKAEELTQTEPDTPFAVGANASGTGGGG